SSARASDLADAQTSGTGRAAESLNSRRAWREPGTKPGIVSGHLVRPAVVPLLFTAIPRTTDVATTLDGVRRRKRLRIVDPESGSHGTTRPHATRDRRIQWLSGDVLPVGNAQLNDVADSHRP